MINQQIRLQLTELAEEKYQQFLQKLLPNVNNILGIRMPLLRKMAQQIAKGDWENYLIHAKNESYEEIMLQGLVIGYGKCSDEKRFNYITQFVPKITNWGLCDSFCAGLKFAKKSPEKVWQFIQPYFNSSQTYDIRFAVVMCIFHYMNEQKIVEVLPILNRITHSDYYVKMAVAWAISIYYVNFPELTLPYLEKNDLDNFTYNKTLQKITESLKISSIEKQKIKAMKR